jgi:hypothetical protein
MLIGGSVEVRGPLAVMSVRGQLVRISKLDVDSRVAATNIPGVETQFPEQPGTGSFEPTCQNA